MKQTEIIYLVPCFCLSVSGWEYFPEVNRCSTFVCNDLLSYTIRFALCIGETLCSQKVLDELKVPLGDAYLLIVVDMFAFIRFVWY